MKALSDAELQDQLPHLSQWRLFDGKLLQDREFPDFVQAMRFVNDVAALAEQQGHHPDIDIRYNRVRLGLVTHDAGGITARDTEMAAEVNRRFPVASAG